VFVERFVERRKSSGSHIPVTSIEILKSIDRCRTICRLIIAKRDFSVEIREFLKILRFFQNFKIIIIYELFRVLATVLGSQPPSQRAEPKTAPQPRRLDAQPHIRRTSTYLGRSSKLDLSHSITSSSHTHVPEPDPRSLNTT
jgi:hypothetical protein